MAPGSLEITPMAERSFQKAAGRGLTESSVYEKDHSVIEIGLHGGRRNGEETRFQGGSLQTRKNRQN